jgi:hypothetical protein
MNRAAARNGDTQTARGARGWRPSPRVGLLVAAAFFVEMTSGCLSNQYRIPQDELARLVHTPPATRGQHVHVVQILAERRSPALPFHPPAPPAPPEPPAPAAQPVADPGPPYAVGEPYADDYQPQGGGVGNVNLDFTIDGSGARHYHQPVAGGSGRAPSSSSWRGGSAPSGMRGSPPQPAWRGSPPAGGAPVKPASGGGGGSSIGHLGGGGGGGGGGGNGGDALVLLAVVLVAIAVVAGVSLVASEGMRFDGYADLAPEQSVHLKNYTGSPTTVSLASLTPADLPNIVEATVNDDEDYGMAVGDRAPLDRRGLSFKVELGSSNFNRGLQQVAGMASQIQIGAFFTRRAGVMLDIGLSGGSVCCDSVVLSRHSLALEGQYFPLALGPVHLGAFAKGGVAIAGDSTTIESGPIFGGGALVEVALTTRLALAFRAAANTAQLPTSGWSTAGTLSGGIAIY